MRTLEKSQDCGLLSGANETWIADFKARHGRKPRVLHIGNIANNAYNNAKILNEAGLENYVVCYDYYHIMGSPEWEDADFSEFSGDQFKPEWYRLDIGGFERPEWFIQGPLKICLRYLDAKLKGLETQEDLRLACLIASGCEPPEAERKRLAFLLRAELLMRRTKVRLRRRLRRIKMLRAAVRRAFSTLEWFIMARYRPFYKKVRSVYDYEFPHGNVVVPTGDPDSLKLLPADLAPYVKYVNTLRDWNKLAFEQCDFIVGYSTDPIIPFLCNRDYFAFEHGTLREIPYEPSAQGRLTALAYRRANHVFLTNFDCHQSAEFLSPDRFTAINHPFDEDHSLGVEGWRELREQLKQELASDFLVFHPTRHDWVEGTGYADKRNDILLQAFCELRSAGHGIGLICCEWGSNVAESKRLLEKSGQSAFVKWIQPLPVVAFERTCLACDLVADQFKLGSFGGVLFKAMATGRPVLTFLDEAKILEHYDECPPVLNCRTQDEIARALVRYLARHGDKDNLAERSRAWVKKHHGKAATVNAQIDQLRLLDLATKINTPNQHEASIK